MQAHALQQEIGSEDDRSINDLAEKLSQYQTHFAYAKPGGSGFKIGRLLSTISPKTLSDFMAKKESVAFVTGVKEDAPRDSRIKSEHIRCKPSIYFDLDLKDQPGWKERVSSSSSDEKLSEVKKIYDSLKPVISSLLGQPWFAVFSGNGLHVHLWLKEPLADLESYQDFYSYLCDHIEHEMERQGKSIKLDRSCKSIDRLQRLPNSTNFKDQNNPIKTVVLDHCQEANSSDKVLTNHNQFREEKAKRLEQKKLQKLTTKHRNTDHTTTDNHKKSVRAALNAADIFEYFGRPFGPGPVGNNGWMVVRAPHRDDGKNPSFSVNDSLKTFRDFGGANDSGDYFDLIALLEGLDCQSDFPKVLEIAEKITRIHRTTKKKEKSEDKKVTYQDYEDFFKQHLPNAMRCFLSREPYTLLEDGKYENIWKLKGVLKSYAYDTGYLKPTPVSYHIERFCRNLPLQLLLEIPEWDGRDRIKDLAGCLAIKNISHDHAEYFLKDWLRHVFLRLYDSKIQNRCLLLKGPQGIGKESFINAIVLGLGKYQANLTLSGKPEDNLALLADNIVLKIAEFDKIAEKDSATLKDWITRDSVTFRRPYDRIPETYPCRSSFIGSTNVDNYLKDYTGNRRFVVFDLEKIAWEYPKDENSQILAQGLALSKIDWAKNNSAEDVMASYIKSKTPNNPDTDLVEHYLEKLICLLERMSPDDPNLKNGADGVILIKNSPTIEQLMKELSDDFGLKVNTVRNKLKQFHTRTKAARFWSNHPITP